MQRRGELHLDLKPSNILFVDKTSDRIKIIDFTRARFYRLGEAMREIQEFMAPELAADDAVGITTDMWSVGVLTYLMLSGISPFRGENETVLSCPILTNIPCVLGTRSEKEIF
eukprot:TRINITY_DN49619_c0_g1_i3.p1 TRINITY_DN49619_c0_g1~~TRINITY_DN49619_c0_g1_i3.p1  ORF type:complete len:113 (-),score=18.66 TRINITY_DN49619_c0_g1_i3:163-501(-)